MGVGWIDNIYNNTGSNWYLRSVDDRHNGELKTGRWPSETKFTLDDGKFKLLKPKTHYRASWCGIPWYYQGRHFKVFSQNSSGGVQFYTSEIGAENWIMYLDAFGREVGRQAAPKGSDFRCNLRFEDSGVFLDIVNNNAFSGENALYMIYNESKEWVKVLLPIIASALKGSAK